MDNTHLPDPPPPKPPRLAGEHPLMTTGGIIGIVIALCILLTIIATLS